MSIAYQVLGDGPIDLVLVPGFVSHVELAWEEPRLAHFLTRLASFSRLIVFDKRGTGMSDPVPDATMEERMDDIRAVMEAAGDAIGMVPASGLWLGPGKATGRKLNVKTSRVLDPSDARPSSRVGTSSALERRLEASDRYRAPQPRE